VLYTELGESSIFLLTNNTKKSDLRTLRDIGWIKLTKALVHFKATCPDAVAQCRIINKSLVKPFEEGIDFPKVDKLTEYVSLAEALK
jgi:hypothetical protein